VVIDQAQHMVTFRDATFTVGRAGAGLVFCNGSPENVRVRSDSAPTDATFYSCCFRDSPSGNGLATLSGPHPLTVTCYNCEASRNLQDGFNAHNLGDELAPHTVTLYDCTALENYGWWLGRGRGDGATAHDPNQTLNIHGGLYALNGKTGICVHGGASCYLDGGVCVYGNAHVMSDPGHDVYGLDSYIHVAGGSLGGLGIEGTCLAEIEACANLGYLQAAGSSVARFFGCGWSVTTDLASGFLADWSHQEIALYDAATTSHLEIVALAMPSRPGDSDGDLDVDLFDWAICATCLTGPGVAGESGCAAFRFDGDADVDLADLAGFQRALPWAPGADCQPNRGGP
jgi:hypothetical protein